MARLHHEAGETAFGAAAASCPSEKRIAAARSRGHARPVWRPVDPEGRREPDAVTVALDELVEELGGDVDGSTVEADRRTLERSEW